MTGGAMDHQNYAALFEAANKLRGSVESAEYKHLVLGLIFLKYISDAFEQRRSALEAELSDPSREGYVEDAAERTEILEDRDEYIAENVFWVPEQARWPALLAAASQPDIAGRIDEALEAIERENPALRNVLPRIYARAPLSAELMGSLVETIAKIGFGQDPARPATSSDARTSTSSRSLLGPRAIAAGSSSRQRRSRDCSWRCSSRSRVACSTPRAGRAGCSSNQPDSSRLTAVGRHRSRSMVRSETRRPGGSDE